MRPLGVGDHGTTGLPRHGDGGLQHAVGQHALGVVRQHDDIGFRECCAERGQQRDLHAAADRPGDLLVEPQQLVRARHEPRLHRGRPARIGHQMRRHPRPVAQQIGHFAGGGILADYADDDRPRAQRGDVARHVGRAAQYCAALLGTQHRDRRFRRDAPHLALHIAVQHHVAEHEDRAIREMSEGAGVGFGKIHMQGSVRLIRERRGASMRLTDIKHAARSAGTHHACEPAVLVPRLRCPGQPEVDAANWTGGQDHARN
jgi:hypothetical protein